MAGVTLGPGEYFGRKGGGREGRKGEGGRDHRNHLRSIRDGMGEYNPVGIVITTSHRKTEQV